MYFDIPAGTAVRQSAMHADETDRNGAVIKAPQQPWSVKVRWDDGTVEYCHIEDLEFP